ncbi:MAG: methyltransferase domain-containing protein [Rhizobiales bacterium]|nr:methyltransferase domain-containing protein [Hyphomicrobiales bacterium]
MTDFADARRHMVDGQLRPNDVTDLRILSAMLEVPRERYAPPASASIAYLDLDLPVGEGTAATRRLLKPMMLAKLFNAAEIKSTDRVLDVGCVTGYAAALLARMAAQVVALEQDAGLAKAAKAALSSLPNVTVVSGPLVAGWAQGGPYDLIVLEGATEIEPQGFSGQLKDGGRLICVLGAAPGATAMLYRRSGDDFAGRPLFSAAAPVLPGFVKPPVFAF